MKRKNFRKQTGATLLLSLVFMGGMFAFIGLATDTGHWMVNKTRLQNALDATALSAAISLNADPARVTANAETAGKATFDLFKAGKGNKELSGLASNQLSFQFSKTLTPWVAGSVPPYFVRVSANSLAVAPIFIQVLPAFANPINISAVSTAGAVGQNCTLTPFVLCADMNGGAPDDNCNNDSNGDGNPDCFGYEIGKIKSLVIACQGQDNGGCDPAQGLESGNFNLLNLDDLQGGKDIRDALEDPLGRNICTSGGTLNTKPGYTWGNVKQGIDNRFDSDTQTYSYTAASYSPSAYHDYADNLSGHGIGNGRRTMAAPIGDCRGLQTGNTALPLVNYACLFLTQKAVQQESTKAIMAEFTGAFCPQAGAWSPTHSTLNGPYKVVIFKSEGSGDS